MRHRFSLFLTLAAWLLATGSHWDLLQTFAWGRMIATSAQTMPLMSAVKKTFTPEAMCELCHAVADAKQSAAKDPVLPDAKSTGKILLLCAAEGSTAYSPATFLVGLTHTVPSISGALRAAPPSPPPRALT